MKFCLSVAVLTLAASQAMAVIPVPIQACTRTAIVQHTDTGCADFATKNGCTFEQLLKWNHKLRPDCANLDVGAPICVSVAASAAVHDASTSTHAASTHAATSALKPATSTVAPAAAAAAAVTTSGVSNPATTMVTHAAAVTTTGASRPATTMVAPTTTLQTGSVAMHTNAATSTKSSMVIAAVGLLVSVVYVL